MFLEILGYLLYPILKPLDEIGYWLVKKIL